MPLWLALTIIGAGVAGIALASARSSNMKWADIGAAVLGMVLFVVMLWATVSALSYLPGGPSNKHREATK